MKHENRYRAICEMLQAYDNATGNRGADHVIKHPQEWLNNHFQPFYANAAALLIEAREAMDTKTTDKAALAAIKRIIKNTDLIDLRGIFETVDSAGSAKYTLCDGHRILRLDSDYSSVEHCEKPRVNPENITKMMNDAARYGEKMNLPTVAELKAFIAANKAKYGSKNTIPYCIDGFVYVNPHYLLDFIQALPDCTAYKPANNKSPIYFAADTGDGILLPVNPNSVPAEHKAA